MTHIVIYDREPGTPVHHYAETLGAAVAEVERLRNSEGIESSIFELRPVAFEFQPYFRVSLDGGTYDDEPELEDERDYEDDGTVVGFSAIDLRADEMSGFTTYPIGRRLFSR